jgi:glycosyltransferase involved in cell wall biosynthesis
VTIGVVTTSYPRFDGDPAGSFVAGHVDAMRALGHAVEVVAADRLAGASGLFGRGGAPDALERAPIRTGASAVVVTARLVAAVAARARRWDAMFAHWLVPSAIAALPGALPVVAIAHGGDVFTLRRLHLLAPVLRALRRRGARLVFVGEHLRAIAREAAPGLAPWLDRATIQPMGLALARFTALARTRAATAPPIVLVVARLVPIKGVDVAIAAMPHVQAPARLVIAGDGPERARLVAPPPHRLLGEVTAAARDELLRTAAVVVIPSRVTPAGRTEGTPMIALEALASGVPVIASAVGGLRDLPGVRLVPPDDPRALARAIDHTLADPPSPAALRAGVANLDWREVAPRLLALLRE